MTDFGVKLHIGAHKTATTYIQGVLDLNRGAIAASGTAYWPIETFRPLFWEAYGQRLVRDRNFISKLRLKGRYQDRLMHQRLADLFDLSRNILISEENIIGHCGDLLDGCFYPNARARLALLAEALPARPMEIWLCVREYTGFLSSAYGEALRDGLYRPTDEYVRDHSDINMEWSKLIDVVISVFPSARVYVSKYEEFGESKDRIFHFLTGIPAEDLEMPRAERARESASAKAIAEMAKHAPGLDRKERIFRMLALQHEYPRAQFPEAFNPWSEDFAAAIGQRYESEIAQLRTRTDIEFLA